jgi:hypothetical protein
MMANRMSNRTTRKTNNASARTTAKAARKTTRPAAGSGRPAKPAVRATRKAGSRADAEAPAAVELIVRRGALRRFDALKKKTSELPVIVTWDRRTDERREEGSGTTGERRRTDRRQTPPATWEIADCLVVEPRQRTRARKKTRRDS